MKPVLILFLTIFILGTSNFVQGQGFDVKANGMQTFSFKDDQGRNQATFFSKTPFEDFTGLTTDISGTCSFDVENIAGTLKGEITIPVKSLKTGIKKRDDDLYGSGWLDADEYPTISYKIIGVKKVDSLSPNKLRVEINGEFTLHGVTKKIPVAATLTYLDESPATQKRMPGDLLGVQAEFKIKLTDYDIHHMILGTRVSDEIKIGINFVGTNKFTRPQSGNSKKGAVN